MPHKACYDCNLLFEVDAAHIASMIPCPECGRMLADHTPTDHGGDHSLDGLRLPGGGAATTMLKVPETKRRRHFDVPTQAVALDALEGSVDVPPPDPSVEIPTQAYRMAPEVDEDAPTKALNANALRQAITDGMLDEQPTRALDANQLRAGADAITDQFDDQTNAWSQSPVSDFSEEMPTRALPAMPKDIALGPGPTPPKGTPVGVSGPVPPRRSAGPSVGVSGPVPGRRKPAPAPAASAPPPARPLGAPAGPPPARPLAAPAGPPPARPVAAPAAPPPARPIATPAAPPPARPVAAPAAPVAVAAAPARPASAAPAPVAAKAPLPPPPEPSPDDGHSYFDQSRAMELPDALGELLNVNAPAGENAAAAPAARGTVARPVKRKSKRTLFIILGTFLVVVAGAIALILTRDNDPGRAVSVGTDASGTTDAAPADDGPKWQKTFDTALTRNKARLPSVTQGESLEEGDFVVAGPDGLATHKGSVVGLMRTPFPDGSLSTTDLGEEARPLIGALRAGRTAGNDVQLYAAIDRRVTARTVAQILNSAKTAGYARVSLIGRRGGDTGELIALPARAYVPGTPPPSAGGVELRIGRLGINAVVKGRDGRPMSKRPATVPRAGGGFDVNALDTMLDTLSSGHPMVREAVVHVSGDLDLETLMAVLGRVRGSGTRDRFASISLSVK